MLLVQYIIVVTIMTMCLQNLLTPPHFSSQNATPLHYISLHLLTALVLMRLPGLLRRVIEIPDKEVTGDEAALLRRATAFNFPAILVSAGIEQWPLLQPAHRALLQAVDPAVRKTLACSLHELARLLGPEKALQDLGATIQVSSNSLHTSLVPGLSPSPTFDARLHLYQNSLHPTFDARLHMYQNSLHDHAQNPPMVGFQGIHVWGHVCA